MLTALSWSAASVVQPHRTDCCHPLPSGASAQTDQAAPELAAALLLSLDHPDHPNPTGKVRLKRHRVTGTAYILILD